MQAVPWQSYPTPHLYKSDHIGNLEAILNFVSSQQNQKKNTGRTNLSYTRQFRAPQRLELEGIWDSIWKCTKAKNVRGRGREPLSLNVCQYKCQSV